jgi:hypothetical protein
MSINHEFAADCIEITVELPHPISVTEDNLESTWSAARLFVGSDKSIPHCRVDAENLKEFRANFRADNTLGSVFVNHGVTASPMDGKILKGVIFTSEIEEIGIRERIQLHVRSVLANVGASDASQSLRGWKREWL